MVHSHSFSFALDRFMVLCSVKGNGDDDHGKASFLVRATMTTTKTMMTVRAMMMAMTVKGL
jgi:hypothetical protein